MHDPAANDQGLEGEDHGNVTPIKSAPAEQPVAVAKLLDALPGIVGGIDRAIFDQSGVKAPFVLLVFTNGGALHATNITPASLAVQAVKDLAKHWDDGADIATHTPSGDAAG